MEFQQEKNGGVASRLLTVGEILTADFSLNCTVFLGAVRVSFGEGIVISSISGPSWFTSGAGRQHRSSPPPRGTPSIGESRSREESRPYPCSRLPGRLLTDVRGSPAAAERVPSERGAAHNLAGTALRLR